MTQSHSIRLIGPWLARFSWQAISDLQPRLTWEHRIRLPLETPAWASLMEQARHAGEPMDDPEVRCQVELVRRFNWPHAIGEESIAILAESDLTWSDWQLNQTSIDFAQNRSAPVELLLQPRNELVLRAELTQLTSFQVTDCRLLIG